MILAGETLFTIPCEAIFNTHPAVARTALVGVSRRGEVVPVICVECVEPVWRLSLAERKRLKGELIERGSAFAHTKNIQTVLVSSFIPCGYSP